MGEKTKKTSKNPNTPNTGAELFYILPCSQKNNSTQQNITEKTKNLSTAEALLHLYWIYRGAQSPNIPPLNWLTKLIDWLILDSKNSRNWRFPNNLEGRGEEENGTVNGLWWGWWAIMLKGRGGWGRRLGRRGVGTRSPPIIIKPFFIYNK